MVIFFLNTILAVRITRVDDYFFLVARNGEGTIRVKWDNGSTVYVSLSGLDQCTINGMCGNHDSIASIESKGLPSSICEHIYLLLHMYLTCYVEL